MVWYNHRQFCMCIICQSNHAAVAQKKSIHNWRLNNAEVKTKTFFFFKENEKWQKMYHLPVAKQMVMKNTIATVNVCDDFFSGPSAMFVFWLLLSFCFLRENVSSFKCRLSFLLQLLLSYSSKVAVVLLGFVCVCVCVIVATFPIHYTPSFFFLFLLF